MITDAKILEQQLIQIENLKTWLIDIPLLHPDSDKYAALWSKYYKYCIEGLWGYDNGGWRYMPGTLFFYGNFFTIEDFDESEKVRYSIRPMIRDLDWMIHYAYLEAQGFSGWKDDDVYTSDFAVLNQQQIDKYKNSKKPNEYKRYLNLVDKDGKLKTFMHPRDNIRMLHKEKLGVPLYHNDAKNLIVFGSRGGGKSFSFAGITAHHLTFDAMKYFDDSVLDNPPKIEVCIGASDTNKSSDLCSKIESGLKAFGKYSKLGVWGNIYDDDYTPNAFYRDWAGSLESGNKDNPFRYEYKAKINGRWIPGQGSGSKLVHVNYSDKKQGGEAAAAGGRYVLTIYEEIGLQANFIHALQSNKGTVMGNAGQQGVQVGIGTSGNIELVQQSKKVFTNPSEYNFLEYEDIWENSGKIGFFLPAYLTDVTFKDENGNTNIYEALAHYGKQRENAMAISDPEVLRFEKMNYPLVPSDMWVSNKGYYFPVTELLERERELVKKSLYKDLATPTKLIWDANAQNGVRDELDQEAEPFYQFPYGKQMSKLDGAIMIYQRPEYINGEIPKDMYIFTLDPYVADNVDEGGSLGAFYGFVNPKYANHNGGTMVCSYIGKHPNGREGFYENCEKIIAFYGDCNRALWYEDNRGDSVRGYFVRKRKTHLLALTPSRERGKSTTEKRTVTYGVNVSNAEFKLQLISDTGDLLLSKVMYDGKEMFYYQTLPDLFLIKQMSSFEIKKHKNFDAVSAFIIAPYVFKELQHITLHELEKKYKHNPLAALSMNPLVFKPEDTENRLHKFKDKYQKLYEQPIYE